MNKQRVDIEFDVVDLEWAKKQAALKGMSRRKFLAMCVTKERMFENYQNIIKKTKL